MVPRLRTRRDKRFSSTVRKGDVVVATKLDRLARSMRDLLDIVARIEAKGASLRILAINLDTTTATGKLMLNVLGSVAEFERSMMLERQRVGIAKAKREGKFKGRAPTVQKQSVEIETLLAQGLGPTDVAEKLGVARSSVYRVADKALRAGGRTVRGYLPANRLPEVVALLRSDPSIRPALTNRLPCEGESLSAHRRARR